MYLICILYVFLQLEEFVTSIIGYRLFNIHHVLRLLEFMPVGFNLVKRVITSLNNLHCDIDTGILHSLAMYFICIFGPPNEQVKSKKLCFSQNMYFVCIFKITKNFKTSKSKNRNKIH